MKQKIKSYVEEIILFISELCRIDLIFLSYRFIGVPIHDDYEKWETAFLTSLKKILPKPKASIIFDIGSNTGQSTRELFEYFGSAESDIYSFEPNPFSYKELKERFGLFGREYELPSGKAKLARFYNNPIKIQKLGLSSWEDKKEMYVYEDDLTTSSGTIYEDIFKRKNRSYTSFEAEFTTIDIFCQEQYLKSIDFIKMDVEGHELEILKGAKNMLPNIRVIQFEFNVHNIISRVFLRDFYELMPQFEFYRIGNNKLVPLGAYKSHNEIFRIQNLVAMNRNLTNEDLIKKVWFDKIT